jgi:hypothetical protein
MTTRHFIIPPAPTNRRLPDPAHGSQPQRSFRTVWMVKWEWRESLSDAKKEASVTY